MKKNRLRISLFLVFILFANNVFSQKFHANLSKVDSSGFYMINIPMEILKEVGDLSDFLLINDQEEVVPYLVRDIDNIKINRSFRNYKSDVSNSENSTKIVIETDKRPIDHFYIQVNNSQVIKSAFILGSDDSLNWFNVRDKVVLNPERETGTQVLLKVEFPRSDYRMYKTVISDSLSAPLKITGAKYVITDTVKVDNLFETLVENINYDESNPNIVQLSMSLPKNVFINDVNVYVSSPRFFDREVRLYKSKKPVEGRNRKGKRRRSTPTYRSCNLISNEDGISTLHIADKCDSLYLDIMSGNNAPLSIDSITFTTTKQELIAYLEKGSYSLLYGGTPQQSRYDMSFVKHIPQTIQELEIISIKASTQVEAPKSKSILRAFIEKHSILIIIIIAIIAILSISYQLIRDKREQ